jgi:hypothetical protein
MGAAVQFWRNDNESKLIAQNRFAAPVTRDQTLRVRAVLRKHGAFTNSRGIFDRGILRHEVFAHGKGIIRRLEYAATPTWQGQDATALPGDATIPVAPARNWTITTW